MMKKRTMRTPFSATKKKELNLVRESQRPKVPNKQRDLTPRSSRK